MARIEARTASTDVKTLTADCPVTVQVGHWVYITGPKTVNYQVDVVDPSSPVKIPAIGIVISKPNTTTALVQWRGLLINVVTGLTPRKTCFVGLNGYTTQTPPSSPNFIQPIGVATGTVEMIVRPMFSTLPVPSYASHLGTTDGNTDGRITFPSGTAGRVSAPTVPGTPYYAFSRVGDWSNPSADHPGTRSSPVTVITTGDVTELDVGTTVRIRFLGFTSSGGGQTTLAEESFVCSGVNQVSTPNGYVRTTGVHENAGRKEGRIQATLALGTLLLAGGYVWIRIIHEGTSGGTYEEDWEIFYDGPYGSPPMPLGASVGEFSAVLKYLSGIRFYDIGSQFDVSGTVSSAFSAMYHVSPVLLDLSQLAVPGPTSLSYDDAGITPAHPPVPKWNDDLAWSKRVTVSVSGRRYYDAIIQQRAQDPFAVSSANSSSSGPIMIDTTPQGSTDVDESFDDEAYRLVPQTLWSSAPVTPPTGPVKFNSTAVLDNASALGGQVYSGQLIYPSVNFLTPASRRPVQQAGTNYSLLSGVRDFQRAFKHDTTPSTRSNVVLYIPGFDVTTIGGGSPDIQAGGAGTTNMFLMLPGISSVWFDCGQQYFSSQFPSPQPGCVVKSLSGIAGGFPSNEYWYCTFGTFSTTPVDRTAILRVEYRATPPKVLARVLAYNWT
jgi:hypothetical protein